MSDVKIQINSKDALERLIGGDSQLELELRRNVAEQFAGKYLKSIIHDKLIDAAKNTITGDIARQFLRTESRKDSFGWNKDTTVLNTEGRELIQREVRTYVDQYIKEFIADMFDVNALRTKIQQEVDAAAARIANDITDSNLKYRVDALAEKKIKEKLGLK